MSGDGAVCYTLELDAREAEQLGFALSTAKRSFRNQANLAKPGPWREFLLDRIRDVEALEWKLDRCPVA